jgi:hypothetical protein
MLIKTSQVTGLSVFSDLSDTYDNLSDKIHLDYKDGILKLTQLGKIVKIQKIIKVENAKDEPFQLLYDTRSFVQLIRNIPSDFILTEEGIKLVNKDALYTLDAQDSRGYPETDSVFANTQGRKIILKDLKKLHRAVSYTGTDLLSVVSLQEDHFAASDGSLVYLVKTDNTIVRGNEDGITLNIPKEIAQLLSKYDTPDLAVTLWDIGGTACWSFMFDDFSITVVEQDYTLPNLMTDEYKQQYGHKEYVEIDAEAFTEVLRRMNIIAQDNSYNRIFINIVSEDEIIVESKDHNKSRESLPAVVSSKDILTDPENIEAQVVLSCSFLFKILQDLEGKKVKMFVSSNKALFDVVRFEGEKDDVKIIHRLYSAQ